MESTTDTCSLKESSLARVYRGLLLFLFICLAATRIIFVLWGYMEEVMQIAICLAACFAVMYGFRRKTILRGKNRQFMPDTCLRVCHELFRCTYEKCNMGDIGFADFLSLPQLVNYGVSKT